MIAMALTHLPYSVLFKESDTENDWHKGNCTGSNWNNDTSSRLFSSHFKIIKSRKLKIRPNDTFCSFPPPPFLLNDLLIASLLSMLIQTQSTNAAFGTISFPLFLSFDYSFWSLSCFLSSCCLSSFTVLLLSFLHPLSKLLVSVPLRWSVMRRRCVARSVMPSRTSTVSGRNLSAIVHHDFSFFCTSGCCTRATSVFPPKRHTIPPVILPLSSVCQHYKGINTFIHSLKTVKYCILTLMWQKNYRCLNLVCQQPKNTWFWMGI